MPDHRAPTDQPTKGRKQRKQRAKNAPPPENTATRLEARLNRRLELAWALGLLAVMLALRVLFIVEFKGRVSESADTSSFVEMARQIVAGDVLLDGQSLIFSPLYAYFLAAIFAVTGQHYLPVIILQCILGTFGAYLTWRLARELFGPLAALFTLGLTAFYGASLAYEGQVLDAPFAMVFPPAFLLVLHRAQKSNSPWPWVAGGAILGFFAWTRPNCLLVAPFAAAWAYFLPGQAERKQRLTKAALILAGVAAAVLPITARNLIATGTPTLLTTHGGLNFFIGNNPGATGFLTPPPGWVALPGQFNQAIPKQAAEAESGRTGMTDAEVSDYWFSRGLDFFRKTPGAAFGLLLRKTRIFLNSAEVESNVDLGLLKEISTAIRLAFVGIGLVMPLGLLGMILALRQWRQNLLFYAYFVATAASVILFFVTARYRLPAVPVLLIYAGFALRELVAAASRLGRFSALAGAGIVLALFVNADLGIRVNPAVLAHSQGFTLEGLGRENEAAIRYERALRLNPNLLLTRLQLARIQVRQGKLEEASKNYEAAARLAPDNPAVLSEVARFRSQMSRAE